MANQHTKAKEDRQRLEDELLEVARKRFAAAQEAEQDMRTEFTLDLQFRAGDQWPAAIKSKRDSQGKPCLTVNRLQQFEKQVTNQMRQARPAIQVSPADHQGDDETAEIIQGLVRHIEYDSNASVAYERGGTSAVRGGIGFWRVLPEYEDENSFNQVLKIKSIRDAMMVSIDPASQEPDGSDMKFAFIYEDLPKEEFEEAYPEAKSGSTESFSALNSSAPHWLNGNKIRVAEYYWIEYKEQTLYEGQDGTISTEKPEVVKRQRVARVPKVMWAKITGVEVLEGPIEQRGPWIPVIPCYGDEMVVDGKVIHEGLIRHARDSVRMSNYWASKEAEAIALAPKAPFIVAEGQIEGHEQEWARANNDDLAYLTYKPTTINEHLVGPPQRNVVEPAIQAISHARMMCIEDLKAITGIFDPSLGNRDAAQSGVAIRQLQNQGSNANFHFVDNQHRSILHTGRVIVSLIPHYYDREMVVRIIGDDDQPKLVTVNGPSGKKDENGIDKIYDVRTGRYHVTLSAGPSYQTKRQEEAVFFEKAMQAWPQIMTLAGDLMFRAQDSPGAELIAARLEKALPPQLRDQDPSNPQQMQAQQAQAQLQQAQALIQRLTEELHKALDKAEANDIKVQIATMQEETKRLIALLTTGSKNAQVELQHSVAVLEAQADRAHQATLAAPTVQAGPTAPEQSLIPAPTASAGGPPAGQPEGNPYSAGVTAGQEM